MLPVAHRGGRGLHQLTTGLSRPVRVDGPAGHPTSPNRLRSEPWRTVGETILEVRDLNKSFYGVAANDQGQLRPAGGRGPRPAGRERRRQVDALLGAGRPVPARLGRDAASTGSRVSLRSPHEARRARDRHGVPALPAGSLPHRGREPGAGAQGPGRPPDASRGGDPGGRDRRGVRTQRPSRAPTSGSCRWAEQQRVEILKQLYRGARILILDEPTAVLAPPGVREAVRGGAPHGATRTTRWCWSRTRWRRSSATPTG